MTANLLALVSSSSSSPCIEAAEEPWLQSMVWLTRGRSERWARSCRRPTARWSRAGPRPPLHDHPTTWHKDPFICCDSAPRSDSCDRPSSSTVVWSSYGLRTVVEEEVAEEDERRADQQVVVAGLHGARQAVKVALSHHLPHAPHCTDTWEQQQQSRPRSTARIVVV